MKNRSARMAVGVGLGMTLLAAGAYMLSRTLGNLEPNPVFGGKTIPAWQEALNTKDRAASNAAFVAVSSQVVPELVNAMLHDTKDSQLRLSLVHLLNQMPGIHIDYLESGTRRAYAAVALGQLGPVAGTAVPQLISVVRSDAPLVKSSAMLALGKIHSDPATVIPVLIPYLEDDGLDVPAARALAEFGPLARAAVPKLLPLLHASDRDDQAAAQEALLRIDPEAAAEAGVPRRSPSPNR